MMDDAEFRRDNAEFREDMTYMTSLVDQIIAAWEAIGAQTQLSNPIEG